MQSKPLNSDAQLLAEALARKPEIPTSGEVLHVDGVGGRLYFAYEQLRNAAEYTEQHLIMRRAVERFLQRNANLADPRPLAQELVIELTQSRYVPNDTISQGTIAAMDQTYYQFAELYKHARAFHKSSADLREWILQTASVHLEQFLAPNSHTGAFSDFAYRHYRDAVKEDSLREGIDEQTYDLALYCATHRAIMKSDTATIRAYALSSRVMVNGPEDPVQYFVELCKKIDDLLRDKLTNRIQRLISQHGAPLRVLREVVVTDPAAADYLQDRNRMLERTRNATEEQYALVRKRLNAGIIRSVIFIAITKIVLGIGVEVPYDYVRHGHIVWRPLILNILFPPLYMATLGLGIRPPNRRNVALIEEAVDKILYQSETPISYKMKRRVTSAAANSFFNTIYFFFFTGLLVGLAFLLHAIGFNLVSGIIFFIFLSTVSFFGFRLTQTAREYELIEGRRSTFGLIGDFIYTPFIRIGHWLSDTYSRLNVVTRVLDIFIEMPMKTILRFLRQWVGFLRDKQEEI